MVTVAVLAILMAVAIPSFVDYRQRAAVRGAADQIASIWGNARFEALRRNGLVKVSFVTDPSGSFCIGTSVATGANDNTACNCLAAACGLSNYPASQSDWRGARFLGNPTIGDTDTDATGVVVLDPKRGNIAEAGDVGSFFLQSPANGREYRLNFAIDRNGRGFICEPSAATNKLPQFTNRRC
jgi:type IV fimbrial biogenesis protein FimT